LMVYLALLYGYNLLPLDITVSPVEIYHKWRDGRVVLVPFSYAFEAPAQAVYSLVTDVLIWFPAGFLWRRASARSSVSLWLSALGAAVALEVLQLGIYSRVSDITDVFTAAIGLAAGISFGARWRANHESSDRRAPSLLWLGGTLLWSAGICAMFWYPFDFNWNAAFVKARLHTLLRAPFTAYYYGTEFRAVTEVLHKTGFFLPLGLFLGHSVRPLRTSPWFGVALVAATGWIVGVALLVEGGQLLLADKFPDVTDLVLEVLGGCGGVWLAAKLGPQPVAATSARAYRHLRQ
jgi:glycopeptide antibiotics resistance protein